jgi:hypothetical protein
MLLRTKHTLTITNWVKVSKDILTSDNRETLLFSVVLLYFLATPWQDRRIAFQDIATGVREGRFLDYVHGACLTGLLAVYMHIYCLFIQEPA